MDILLDIIETFDYDILLQISKAWRGGLSDTIWAWISRIGNGGACWIGLAVFLILFRRTRRAGVAILMSLLFSAFLGNLVLKPLVMRPRPFVTHPDLTALVIPGDPWSFPSGHTMSSFAAASAFCMYHPKSGALACILAGLIGFSRLYACVHYPTDVLAGLLLGIPCGLLAGWLTEHFINELYASGMKRGS